MIEEKRCCSRRAFVCSADNGANKFRLRHSYSHCSPVPLQRRVALHIDQCLRLPQRDGISRAVLQAKLRDADIGRTKQTLSSNTGYFLLSPGTTGGDRREPVLLAMSVDVLSNIGVMERSHAVRTFPPLVGAPATPRPCLGRPVFALAAGQQDVAGCKAVKTPWCLYRRNKQTFKSNTGSLLLAPGT